MKNRQNLLVVLLLSAIVVMCHKEQSVPLAETIQHVWTAQTVRENNTLVYTKGAAANIRNYTGFKLDLSKSPTVSFTDVDGTTFTGQYELQGSTTIVLKNLQPQPTGTGGTLTFTINSVNTGSLDITRITASQKTGGTVNEYQLTTN